MTSIQDTNQSVLIKFCFISFLISLRHTKLRNYCSWKYLTKFPVYVKNKATLHDSRSFICPKNDCTMSSSPWEWAVYTKLLESPIIGQVDQACLLNYFQSIGSILVRVWHTRIEKVCVFSISLSTDLQNCSSMDDGNSLLYRLPKAKSYFRNFKNTPFRNDSHKH